ncbi:MAG TPA: DUF2064 domain-containing protein [Acidimicrobiia bacterium]|nr:DUF2064 domain-containing protein [Acidimicrobiia bacterium]
MSRLHVLVMAKSPRPGRVKTRLCPPCTPEEAAQVATAALADTLTAVAACGAVRKVLALDGEPGPWLPPGFEIVLQRGGTFNDRLTNAWADTGGPGLQIGMDTPQVTPSELDGLLARLDDGPGRPAVLGHALDGGWWVVGWRRAEPRAVFAGIPMSAPTTGLAQETRLLDLGFDIVRADPKRDIDTIDDLTAVASAAPQLRTAGLARQLALEPSPVVLRADDGTALPLEPLRWHAEPSLPEQALLAGVAGPVLDVGCGPGRLVLAVARRGEVALGVDPAPAACALARDRGAAVLQRSVFDPLPGAGRWRTILLADGNIGIGGDPARLLRRCRDLLAPDGTIVAEVDAPAARPAAPHPAAARPEVAPSPGWRRYRVRLERGPHHGPWFSWAVVHADAIAALADAAGLELRHLQPIAAEGRYFAHLGLRRRPEERSVAVA